MLIDFSGPVIFLAITILFALLTWLKLKRGKSNIYLLLFTIFYFYLCNVLNYTQFPIIISETMRAQIGQNLWRDANFIPLVSLSLEKLKPSLLNILLTVPFGFGISFLIRTNLKGIVALGISLGLTLETLQLVTAMLVGYTFRYVDINDVIFNATGAVLGYGIFLIFHQVYRKLVDRLDIPLNPFLRFIYDTRQN